MAKKKETKRRGLFGLFGKKDGEDAGEQGAQPPAGGGAPQQAPQSDSDVWHKPPEHSGETGHVQFGQGQVPDGADFDPGELTMAPGYAMPGGMDPSQMTIPPNYNAGGGAPGGGGGGGKDPFDFDPGELTMGA